MTVPFAEVVSAPFGTEGVTTLRRPYWVRRGETLDAPWVSENLFWPNPFSKPHDDPRPHDSFESLQFELKRNTSLSFN